MKYEEFNQIRYSDIPPAQPSKTTLNIRAYIKHINSSAFRGVRKISDVTDATGPPAIDDSPPSQLKASLTPIPLVSNS